MANLTGQVPHEYSNTGTFESTETMILTVEMLHQKDDKHLENDNDEKIVMGDAEIELNVSKVQPGGYEEIKRYNEARRNSSDLTK